MNGVRLDDLGLEEIDIRTELTVATDEALNLADSLALEVVDSPKKTPRTFKLARDYQEKRLLVRRLRRALAVEVAG